MIGIIVPAVKGYVIPFDPDTAFDPTTHIATEEAFIQLLENGIYDEKYIGYMVTLSNSAAYDGGVWVIADVNHDSANTGQTDCYDLISRDCFNYINVGYYGWGTSTEPVKWLNNTFYSGFNSNFKSHLLNIKYSQNGNWYNTEKIIIPSDKELGFNNYYSYKDGLTYSIFTDDNSRRKYAFGTSNYENWWTRSYNTSSGEYYYVTNGGYSSSSSGNNYRAVSIIRVH